MWGNAPTLYILAYPSRHSNSQPLKPGSSYFGMWSQILFLTLISCVYGLTCYDCGPLYLPSNQCTRSKECPNGFCTYYNKTIQNRSNINFQCSSSAQLNAPGGSVFSTRNKCVQMRDGDTYYRLKICNDYDLCNAECNNGYKNSLNSIHLLIIIAIMKSLM